MALTPAQLAQLQAQYGNIGTPTANTDNRYGANGGGNGYYSAGGLDYLTPTAGGGFSGPVGAPFDQPGAGGQYGQYQGTFGADGSLTGGNFQPMQRESWLDKNGWIAPLLPIAAAGVGAAMGGQGIPGFSGAPAAGGEGYGIVGGATEPVSMMAGGEGAAGGAGYGVIGGATEPVASLGSTGAAGAPITASTMTSVGAGAAGAGGGILDGLGGAKGIAGLVGAAAGALGGGADTATKSSNVPEWAQPYSRDLVQRGQDIANTPFQPYTGQRYAGPNDAMKDSWEMASQFARGGPSADEATSQGTFRRLQSGATPNFGKAQQISNQYIGNAPTSNVSGLVNGGANPFLGQTTGQLDPLRQMNLAQTTTQVGTNPYFGKNNPYLNDAIGYATGDITRNFTDTVNPGFDRMARASGSFGNSGVEEARANAQRTMAQQIGRTTSDMRMADYTMQAGLGEADVNRRLSTSLTDTARNLGASKDMQAFNIGNDYLVNKGNLDYRSGDLTRNVNAYDKGQDRILDAGKFDAKYGADTWATNLGATTDLGKFNAGQTNLDIAGNRADWNSAENRAVQTMDAYKGYDDATLRRAGVLGATGATMQAEAQKPLDFNYAEFLRQQQEPATKLGVYGTAYNTGVGGQSVQTTPTGNSTAANVVGGAAAGLGFYDMLTRPTASTSTNYPSNYVFDPITGARR